MSGKYGIPEKFGKFSSMLITKQCFLLLNSEENQEFRLNCTETYLTISFQEKVMLIK